MEYMESMKRDSQEFKQLKANFEAQECLENMLRRFPDLKKSPQFADIEKRVHAACETYNGVK